MPSSPAFFQNIIALVWDFDKTLITEYMQGPLFRHYGVEPKDFWNEVNGLDAYYRQQNIVVNRDTIYLNHLLTWVQQGAFQGLTNQMLHEFGSALEFFPGLPHFFEQLKQSIQQQPRFAAHNIQVEHYIVSTGFAQTIRGSVIAPYVKQIWGCEFIETPALPGYLNSDTPSPASQTSPQITQVASAMDNTSKTRVLFEISKGSHQSPHIDVNSKMELSNLRVPFQNMIYIADGPSDVPAFSLLQHFGGHPFAIYPKGHRESLRQVEQLRRDGRIHMYGEADYQENSTTAMWLMETTETIAERIVKQREEQIQQGTSRPPRHLNS